MRSLAGGVDDMGGRRPELVRAWGSTVILEPRKIKSDTVSTVSHLFPMK